MEISRIEAMALSMHFHRMEQKGIELSPEMETLWRKITAFLQT